MELIRSVSRRNTRIGKHSRMECLLQHLSPCAVILSFLVLNTSYKAGTDSTDFFHLVMWCDVMCCLCSIQIGGTPLMMAAGGGHVKAVIALLKAGANIDLVDNVSMLVCRCLKHFSCLLVASHLHSFFLFFTFSSTVSHLLLLHVFFLFFSSSPSLSFKFSSTPFS